MVILQLEEQPAIIQAIFAGVIDEVHELIENKQDINCLDCEKRTPLHAAAFKGEVDITNVLLQNGARVNAKDSKWVTPLHRACSVGAEEVVALLLCYQADVGARDRLWQTPLHIAAANGSYSCIEQLLNHVPNLNVTDRSGRTALHHASYNGHTDVVELLLSRGAMVNACDKKDCRPLHCAVQMAHDDTIEILLKFGADINAKDRNQYTPLHVVSASGIDSICKLLLNAGADVDAQNVYGNTPLHIACLNGRLTVAQDLVVGGANLESINFRGQTPLHIAAASVDGVECLMFLLRQNIDLNKQSSDGRTPLHMTAIHGRFTRSKTLMDNGALLDCPDKNGCTPLHIAAQYGHDLFAYTLMTYGANASKKGYEGRTPLHMCCLAGYVECARRFVQSGVDLNDQDETGKTPTHCAAYKGSFECLDLLVSNEADFKIVDNLQRLPIHYAASRGNDQCVYTLVGIGSPINAPDVEGCTPLHLAAAYDHECKCILYLLNHKADTSLRDNRAFYSTVSRSKLKNITKANPFTMACKFPTENNVIFSSCGKSQVGLIEGGFTPLHYAIAGGNVEGVQMLLDNEQKLQEQKCQNIDGIKRMINKCSVDIMPLHLAAKLGNIEILRMIMPHCEDVNVRTNQGITPLVLAAREGHVQCVHFLLRFGAKVALADNINFMTPVHYSAKNGHSQCLTMLLHNSEDQNVVNMLDRQHRTALMLSVSGNHIDCVQTLLKCGADPNIVDTDEHSCLFRAVVNGHDGVVQLLLSNNAKVQTTDVNGKTVLHLAAACGHFVCMQMILDYMTENEVKAKDNQQCTALHWACYNGYANCVEYLLDKNIFKELEENSFSPVHCATFSGSDKCLELLVNYFGVKVVHYKDCRGRTPLHLAALHGHMECARYLIEQGAEVQVVDEEGRTPFIAAAQYGQTQIIELLLTCNIDRASCDKLGNTALHWACLKKHNQTALLILEDPQGETIISIANNDNKTPLHISSRNGLVDVTRDLLKKGASILAVDNEGLTPALCCAPNNNVAQCLALILQSLPQFLDRNSTQNDSLNLASFYHNLTQNENTCKYKDEYSQTMSSQLKNLHFSSGQKMSQKKTLRKCATFLNLDENESNCFINEDKLDISWEQRRPPEKLGFSLHKSYSDMSIIAPKQWKQVHTGKKRHCRECYRLQHRCEECSLRLLLKKHLTGRTTQEEFQKFISKCLTESSKEYHLLFNSTLDSISKELNLYDKPSKLHKKRTSESIGYHMMLLNRNKSLIGIVKKHSLSTKTDQEMRINMIPVSYSKIEINPYVSGNDIEITRFVLDKNDPLLRAVIESCSRAIEMNSSFKPLDSGVSKSLEMIPQFHLETSKNRNEKASENRILTPFHSELISIFPEKQNSQELVLNREHVGIQSEDKINTSTHECEDNFVRNNSLVFSDNFNSERSLMKKKKSKPEVVCNMI